MCWIRAKWALDVFETSAGSLSHVGLKRKKWTLKTFLFSCRFSVCARWWATQGACGHLRWETTLLSAAPPIAHSRSGTQRQENVSTPSMGIPQQCAACTYMRKGTRASMLAACWSSTLGLCQLFLQKSHFNWKKFFLQTEWSYVSILFWFFCSFSWNKIQFHSAGFYST